MKRACGSRVHVCARVHLCLDVWSRVTHLWMPFFFFYKRLQMKKCKLLLAVTSCCENTLVHTLTHTHTCTRTHHMELFSVDEWSCLPAGYEIICRALLASLQGLKPERKPRWCIMFLKVFLVNLQCCTTLDGYVWQRASAVPLPSSRGGVQRSLRFRLINQVELKQPRKWSRIVTHRERQRVLISWEYLHRGLNAVNDVISTDYCH